MLIIPLLFALLLAWAVISLIIIQSLKAKALFYHKQADQYASQLMTHKMRADKFERLYANVIIERQAPRA